MNEILLEVALGLVAVPWIVFVTSSIYSQKQEIALLKSTHESFNEHIKTLIKLLSSNKKAGR